MNDPQITVGEGIYPVEGAGELHFGANANSWCANAVGFHIGVSWGRHGLAGGVIDREDAKRLADAIYAALESDDLKSREDVMRVDP